MDVAPVFHPTRSKYLLVTTDIIIPLIVILSIVTLVYLSLFSPFFAITHIQCQLDYASCDNTPILAEIERVQGQNLVRFDSSAFSARLTSADFTIREATITKTLPNTLTFSLQSVYPVVALKLAEVSEWIVFDDQLRVIRSLTTDPNVPTVIVPGPVTVTVGRPLDNSDLVSALHFARTVSAQLPRVLTVTLVDATTVDLALPDQRRALLTTSGDLSAQLASLQAILADATIMGKASVIDMRFSQPVLR